MQQYEILDNCGNIDPLIGATKKKLRRNKEFIRKSRIRLIRKTLLLFFASLLILSIPITYACVNPNNNWYILSGGIHTNYNSLSKETINSISDFNKDNNYIIHYFRNVEKKDSYLLKCNDKNALLEEHYIYNDIEISLYMSHKNSSITISDFKDKYNNNMTISDYKIKYYNIDGYYYLEILSGYKYKIKIHTSNLEIVKELINEFK